MTPRVRENLGWYGADNAGTLTNLGRLPNHGRLAGTGKLVMLPGGEIPRSDARDPCRWGEAVRSSAATRSNVPSQTRVLCLAPRWRYTRLPPGCPAAKPALR